MIRKTLLALAVGSAFVASTSNAYAEDDDKKKPESPYPQILLIVADSEGDGFGVPQSDLMPQQPVMMLSEGDEKPQQPAPELIAQSDEKPQQPPPELIAQSDEKPQQPPPELIAQSDEKPQQPPPELIAV